MESTKTYAQLMAFDLHSTKYIAHNQDKKFSHAINAVIKNLESDFKEVNKKTTNINIDLCSEDKNSNILKDDKGNLVFTKEAQKKRNDQIEELMEEEFTFTPTYATQPPDNLTIAQKDAFIGFVISENVTDNRSDVKPEAD